MSKKSRDKEFNKHVTVDKSDSMSDNIVGSTHNGSPSTTGMNGDLDECPQLYIVQTEEDSSAPPDKNKKRINHNATEKNRKDKIKRWINKIGELLPPVGSGSERPLGRSTLEIVEKAWEYINHLKTTNDRLLVEKGDQIHVEEIERLKTDLKNMKMERDRFLDILKSAGLGPSLMHQKHIIIESSTEEPIQNGGNVLSEGSTDKEQEVKNKKTKRRNTISLHLENMKKQQQIQEEQAGGNPELSAPGMMGNFGNLPMNNMIMGAAGPQFVNNANMLMNQMIMGGNQMFGTNQAGMTSIPNVGNQLMGQGQPGSTFGVQGQGQMGDKNAAEVAGAGLLQLAMQDAGITPNSNNKNSGQSVEEVSASTVASETSSQSPKPCDQVVSQPSALQTLASVASNTQNISNTSTSTVSTANTMNNLSSQASSAPTATTQAINTNPIMATGQNGFNQPFPNGNGMMNMQFQINGQQCYTGNMLQQGASAMPTPQGQFMFINEQGVPCIANVPLGMDPSIALQKQIMNMDKNGSMGIPGMLPKDQNQLQANAAMSDQTLITNTLAQQQMNMTLQGQLTGMNSQPFQQAQNAVAMGTGNMMQQAMNNPLAVNQQFLQPMQGQLPGSAVAQQGIIMNQNGNLVTVNSVQNQNNQLPQALILPNGQIIPVVSNPQMYANSSQSISVPQQVLQQNGSVQWQQQNAPTGQQRMALPGLQGKVIAQGQEVPTSAGSGVPGQVLTSTGQIQIGQPQIAMPGQVPQQNQVTLQTGGLLMTTNSTLQTSSTTTTTAAESQPNIVTSTQNIVISQADDPLVQPTSASSITNQFVDSNSANLQNNIYQQNAQNINSGMNNLDKQQGQLVQGQGQLMTSQGQGFLPMQGIDVNVQNTNINNQVVMQSVFNGASNSNVSVSSSEGSAVSTVLAPGNAQLSGSQASAVNGQTPGAGSGGPILLQLSCNGQPTNIVVDPNTMQVLGTFQTSQSQQSAQQPTNQAPPVSQTTQGLTKKNKKGFQRAIYPKPTSNAGTSVANTLSSANALSTNQTPGLWIGSEDGNDQMEVVAPPPPPPPQSKKSSSKSKSKSKNSKTASEPVVSEPQDSTSGSTDILAKAAESIFSTSLSPPVGGFYNPANEDNPLQIDTSAGETEDDPEGSASASASPMKEGHGHQNVVKTAEQKKLEKQSDISNIPEQKQGQGKKDKAQEQNKSSENLSLETEKVVELAKVDETQNLSSDVSDITEKDIEFITASLLEQKNEKEKVVEKDVAQCVEKDVMGSVEMDIGSLDKEERPKKSGKKSSKKASKKKTPNDNKTETDVVQPAVVPPPTTPAASSVAPPTDLPQEEESMIIPDSITFSEKDLSEVLDQVESLGNSMNESSEGMSDPVVTPAKKSKSRKNKANTTSENEPVHKKSKKNSPKEKTSKGKESMLLLESPKNTKAPKSSLSVYDFDGDGSDDIQPPLLSLHNSRASSQNIVAPPQPPITTMAMDTPLFGDFPSVISRKDTPKSRSKSSKSSDKKRNTSGSKSHDNSETLARGVENIAEKVSSKKQEDLLKLQPSKQKENTSVQHHPVSSMSKQNTSNYLHSPQGSSQRIKYDNVDKDRSNNFPLTNQNSALKSNEMISPNQNVASGVLDPVHISTTTSDADIDNTVSSILGLSAASLSPHIISPKQQQTELSHESSYQKQAQRSPVLRTPTSVSPVSMTSVSMANSPPLSQGLQTPKCTSPVPVTTSSSVTKSTSISSTVASSEIFMSNTSGSNAYSSVSFSSPVELAYSAESLFSSSSDKPIRPDTISKTDKLNERLPVSSKSRTSIYSADNFVQSSKSDMNRVDKGNSQASISSPLSAGFGRVQNDNSSDSFNFTNLGLSATTPTTSANSFMDSLSMSPVIATISNTSSASSFTFTLSSVTSTVTTSSAPLPSHQSLHPFPYYQPLHSPPQQMPSSSSSTSSRVSNNHISTSQNEQPMNMSNFDLDLSRGSQMSHQQSQHPQHSGHERMPSSHVPSIFSYGMQESQNCPIREPPHEQPPFFPNITVTTPSSMNKSQSDQIRNTHKQIQDLNMGRNVSSKPHIVEPPSNPVSERNMQISRSSEPRNNAGLDRQVQLSQSSESRTNSGRIDQPVQLSRSSDTRTNVIERPMQMSGSSETRNNGGHDRPMQLTSNTEKRNSAHERTNQISHKAEPRPGSGHMERTTQVSNSDSRTSNNMDRNVQHGHGSDNRTSSGLDRQAQLANSSDSRKDSRLLDRTSHHSHMNSLQSFFPGSNFSNPGSHSLNTPPLHHLPILAQQEERSAINRGSSYESVFPPHSQGYNPATQNFHGRYEHGNVSFQQRDIPGSHRLSHTPPNAEGRKSANPPSHNSKSNKQPQQQPTQVQQQPPPMNVPPPSRSTGPTPPHQPHHRATPPQAAPPQQNPSNQQPRQSKSSASRSKQSQKKNKQQYVEMDTSYPPAMFDANRMTPFFGLPPQNLSPPTRNIQNEGSLFPSNFFAAGSRPLSNSASVPKNAEISSPFNPLFPPSRPQNGLGLNFQHGFGMNHGGMSSAPQITPHSNSVTVTPHMSNFSLTNIFSDVGNSQNESMNISPIKFPHSNPILPPQGMDPNSLQHPHHQGSSLYHHNRGHHPPPPVIHTAMSINSILGHNHHGFDTRPMPRAMNTTAPPFAGHGHPSTFGMPPLDFSMHDH